MEHIKDIIKVEQVEKFYGKLTLLEIGGLAVYFSYETPIAIHDNENNKWVIRENDWSNTTGRHLNYINEDKSIRIAGAEFEKKYRELTSKYLND